LERQDADLIWHGHNFLSKKKPLLGIRIGFSADPDPGSHPDPDPGQTLPSQKGDIFNMEKGLEFRFIC
jgi:hypothetical protein